jgi:predicted PolB exonuclease-like 3'-5' exonuclease
MMLEHFYSHVYDLSTVAHNRGTAEKLMQFCGHNIAGFDLPFLKHRSIIHGVKPPAQLLKAMNGKPWDAGVLDTLLMWSSDPHKRGSMNRLCKALGIVGKGDFDGSMVAETWPVDPQKVISYCKDDIRRTREIYRRLTWA